MSGWSAIHHPDEETSMHREPEGAQDRATRDDEERTRTLPPGWLPPPQEAPRGAVPVVPRGPRRYVVLDRLGAGGMGEVHAAWDRRLDRKVALKLLHPERRGRGDAARLLREAHALARLSHPNVVAVHDVGVADGRVFVAMEFVDGPTLSEWLRGGPEREVPSPRRVLEVFREAGRGLAAVHAAGLVHRDFKPDNVMIRPDGRVLVMDFGLARPAEEGVTATHGAEGEGAAGGALTETGAVVGTPGYMAPEQLRGEPADARSDQYAFCVALRRAVERTARTPRWLRRVVERGTAHRPQARFASMDELLTALAAGLSRRRRRLAAAAVAILVLGGAGAVVQAERIRGARCGGGEARLASVWGPGAAEAVRSSFAATGAPFAESAWQAVSRQLDRWGAGWVDERRRACEATRVEGEQSERLLDLRMACYDRRLRETAALLGVLRDADAGVVENASTAVAGLPPLASCADAEGLLGRTPPPDDPEVLERLAAVEDGVAEVTAWTDTGRYERAAERGEGVLDEARAVGHPPLVGEAAYVLAAARVDLEETEAAIDLLHEALAAAERGGDHGLLGRVAAELVYVHGQLEGREAEGERWHRLAAAALDRAGADPELAFLVPLNRGSALEAAGRYEEAAGWLREAIAAAERHFGPESLDLATAWNNLGAALGAAGRYDEAADALERSVAIKQAVHGREHPALATSLDNLGVTLGYAGRAAEALPLQREAMTIRRRTLPPGHPLIATGHANLASTLTGLGRHEESLEHELLVLAERREGLGEEHYETGISYNNLATTYRALGRVEEGLPHLDRAVAVLETSLGPDHPVVAFALTNRGVALYLLGRPEAALPDLERGLAIRRASDVADKDLAVSLFHLARALTAAGDAAGGDRARARTLAAEAVERYRAAGEGYADGLADAEVLLARLEGGSPRHGAAP
jgi:eukaryotic-like serine/threonine-protein kinase